MKGSNRTFMELKQLIEQKKQSFHTCSNRTFMELKPVENMQKTFEVFGSNRTFMELKLFVILRGLKGEAF